MKNKKKKLWYKHWWMIVIYVFIGFIILGNLIVNEGTKQINDTANEIQKNKKTSSSLNVGDEGRLYLEDSSVVPVCTTKTYLDELIDSAVANDEIGYREMLSGGKCYTASTLDDYGRVLVLDITFGANKFRFLNSDALHYGETAWTNYEYIIPLN